MIDIISHPLSLRQYSSAIATIISMDVAIELFRHFPTDGFHRYCRSKSCKDYSFSIRSLTGRDVGSTHPDLHPCWADAISFLSSHSYRSAVEQLYGISLRHSIQTIDLHLYDRTGDFLAPHLDKSDKIISQVIFLNPIWETHWGGRFLELCSASTEDIHRFVLPTAGNGAVVIPENDSWHAVEPLTTREARKSLQSVFWKS